VNGKIGLLVVGAVVVEYLIEGGNVINPSVHILIIKSAMEIVMKGRHVMIIVAQVSRAVT